jgi:hypothetical protein
VAQVSLNRNAMLMRSRREAQVQPLFEKTAGFEAGVAIIIRLRGAWLP